MNETYAKGIQGMQGFQNANVAIPKAPTLPSLLEEIEKLAVGLKNGALIAADNISGGIPEDCLKTEQSSTFIGKALTIRDVLREANRHQQRALDALAL